MSGWWQVTTQPGSSASVITLKSPAAPPTCTGPQSRMIPSARCVKSPAPSLKTTQVPWLNTTQDLPSPTMMRRQVLASAFSNPAPMRQQPTLRLIQEHTEVVGETEARLAGFARDLACYGPDAITLVPILVGRLVAADACGSARTAVAEMSSKCSSLEVN